MKQKRRLADNTDHIFVHAYINSIFASDGGINERQQGCGYESKAYSPHINRSHIARKVGVIRQPSFLLHDLTFLNTLPESEWRNGFAEIIKHGSIKDAVMFRELEKNTVSFYQKKKADLRSLIERNALIKTRIVQADEWESGERKLLNFGHTLGHALENQYELSHGEAISIGMAYAARLSEQRTGLKQPDRVISLLEKYGLPTFAEFDRDRVVGVLKMDKKKVNDSINFILLEKIGKAVIHKIGIEQIYQTL